MKFAQRTSLIAISALLLQTVQTHGAPSEGEVRLRSAALSGRQPASRQLLEEGWRAYQQGDLAKAVSLYQQAAAANPADPSIWYDLGCLRALQQDTVGARKALVHALKLSPSMAETHDALGQVAEQEGNLEEAASAYEKAHDLMPRESSFLRHRARLALRQNDTAASREWSNRWVAADPGNPQARYQLGVLQLQADMPDLAVVEFEKVVAIDRGHVMGWNGLGLAYARTGLLDKAAQALETARKLQPENPATHANLGIIAVAQQKWDKARAAWMRALELKPDFRPAEHNLQALGGGTTTSTPP